MTSNAPFPPPPLDARRLDARQIYVIEGDDTVRAILGALGVADVFADVPADAVAALAIAFDNHPTHWIIVDLWQNIPADARGYKVHKFASHNGRNGLLFEAYPKSDVRRDVIELRLSNQNRGLIVFAQLPASRI